MGEEDYSVSSADRLRFTTDTLSFDTVIAGHSTNTYTLDVFNPNGRAVRISRVYLERGADSPFRVNADGAFLTGGTTSDLEIAAHDSLRTFIEMTAPPSGKDHPVAHEDRLVFRLESGTEQRVVLQGSGQDVEELRARVFTRDTTLTTSRPYRILDSLVVDRGTTLTLPAGCRLYFHAKAQLIVRGTLIAMGTAEHPVMMRGDRLGNMFSNQPYDRIPNQWGGVILRATSRGNHLDHCDIHSAKFGILAEYSDNAVPKLRLENSIVHNTSDHALCLIGGSSVVGNCQISNASGDCVRLIGGHHRFTHCTLAQFYPFTGGRGVALRLANTEADARRPLDAADFINCLITGYGDDELMGEPSTRYTDLAFNYRFDHCLLRTPRVDDAAHFTGCLFEADSPEAMRSSKQFFPAFDLARLLFTFTLAEGHPAIGAADAAQSQALYPSDRNGTARLTDGRSDIGCYEYLAPAAQQ